MLFGALGACSFATLAVPILSQSVLLPLEEAQMKRFRFVFTVFILILTMGVLVAAVAAAAPSEELNALCTSLYEGVFGVPNGEPLVFASGTWRSSTPVIAAATSTPPAPASRLA
jgi:hypothetical protein